ncbi:pickpocket protein 28-like [Maniola jurtina]|uniref:pickpocket protein 28-like n=1 Tax=Maniola jurtina TaxID=191418 RepID=UPI001E68CF03|nr:pickpocket protein 28-like [Maniola jurtina]
MEERRPQNALNIEMVEEHRDNGQSAELETTRKRNKSSITQNLLKSLNNFNLSLKEARERETTPIEKIVWLVMFTSCFIYCGFLIWKSYSKWMRSPSIVMLTENDQPIREIPFPAVTVCPEMKIMSTVFSFTEYMFNKTYRNLSETEQNMFEDVSLICNNFINHDVLEGRNYSFGNETVSNIRKASAELSQVISMCTWKGKQSSCNNMFTPILTEEGMCFTFNTIGPEDLFRYENLNADYEYMENLKRTKNQGWTLEYGYLPDAPRRTYPIRGSGAGPKAGMELLLTEDMEGLDQECNDWLSGFKILLHTPSDLPRLSQQYIRVPIYQEVTIAFTATLEVTSDGLEVFTPFGRQCYFENERSLAYFKVYSQSNCEYECLTNFTYARCGCVHFSMPHGPDMAICNFGSLKCMSKAEMELSTMDIEDEGRGNVTIDEAIQIADACNCLPACTSITYDTEVIQTELHKDERDTLVFRNDSNGGHMAQSKVSEVVLYFKRPLFDIAKRSELYGTSDILASCGGLLGLFMGFSVINIVEILYFCILRFCRRNQADKCENSNNQTVQQSKEKY